VYYSGGWPGVLELYTKAIYIMESRFNSVGPFNQDHRLRVAEIVEAQHFDKLVVGATHRYLVVPDEDPKDARFDASIQVILADGTRLA
jgi:hypothetical protein